jgi:UDP-N-acetylmuramate: L-alanyl-gamma-D-glutamyl-meso-diaminopimelate ligase
VYVKRQRLLVTDFGAGKKDMTALTHLMKRIYLIGIGGTGMGAFAGLLKKAGYAVQGSDAHLYPPMSIKLKEWGIEVKTPYAKENLQETPDLVIVGNVVSKDNVEAAFASENHLAFTSFPQALSQLFLNKRKSVVVSGTHGKTTTSALIAYTLDHAGLDPSFLIGGIPQNFGESFQLSKKPEGFFVVEGDEYDTAYFDKGPKFLHYQPLFLLCTSLEYDHADIYQNVEQIEDRFKELMVLVPAEGQIVLHASSPHLEKALKKSEHQAPVHTYGPQGDYTAQNSVESEAGCQFDVNFKGQILGSLSLQLSGQHNINNALGAYALLRSMDLSHQEIADGFATFKGVKRRMEEIGEEKGVLVVDDFAHHPSAVETTLQGAKKRYSNRQIWALFEPRSASSCRKIFQEAYAKSFSAADKVFLAPIGRELERDMMLNVPQLAKDINAKGVPAVAFDSLEALLQAVVTEVSSQTVLLCMSNGSFGNIHAKLIEALKHK